MPDPSALAAEGVAAVKAGKYHEGIAKLTTAIKERRAPLWLLERSKAHLRTNSIDLALYDAETALRIAFDRGNRDQMIEAQLRRAITYYRLERYADADTCAFWTIKLCDGARATEDDGQQNKVDSAGDYSVTASEVAQEGSRSQDKINDVLDRKSQTTAKSLRNQAVTWRIQALTQMAKLPAGHKGRKVQISVKYPTPSETPPSKQTDADVTMDDIGDSEDHNETKSTHPESPKSAQTTDGNNGWESLWTRFQAIRVEQTNIRSSFYQTDTTISADFFVKNVPKDQFTVDASSQVLTLRPVPGVFRQEIRLYPFGRINPARTKYTVKSMKIEVVLEKETPGKWPVLRRENADIIDHITNSPGVTDFQTFHDFVTRLGFGKPEELALPSPDKDQSAWYDSLMTKLHDRFKAETKDTSAIPASSNEDSSKADSTITQGPPANDDSKPTSSAPAYPTSAKAGPKNWDKLSADDEEEDKDVNSFFQTIYKNADEDTKRAMMKSYVESNGTSLSTSWAEAKEKTYETHAPDGVEAKAWDKN